MPIRPGGRSLAQGLAGEVFFFARKKVEREGLARLGSNFGNGTNPVHGGVTNEFHLGRPGGMAIPGEGGL